MVDFNDSSHKKTVFFSMGNCNFTNHCMLEDGHCFRAGKDLAMKMILLYFLLCFLCICGGYLYGKSQAKTKIIEKQVEVIKYVAQKRAQIQAMPNANRDELLKLLRSGQL